MTQVQKMSGQAITFGTEMLYGFSRDIGRTARTTTETSHKLEQGPRRVAPLRSALAVRTPSVLS
jgi:hypothetical protein